MLLCRTVGHTTLHVSSGDSLTSKNLWDCFNLFIDSINLELLQETWTDIALFQKKKKDSILHFVNWSLYRFGFRALQASNFHYGNK